MCISSVLHAHEQVHRPSPGLTPKALKREHRRHICASGPCKLGKLDLHHAQHRQHGLMPLSLRHLAICMARAPDPRASSTVEYCRGYAQACCAPGSAKIGDSECCAKGDALLDACRLAIGSCDDDSVSAGLLQFYLTQ